MSISHYRRRAIIAAHGGACHYCGTPDAAHVDHIVPRIDGGTDDLGNLIAACLSCNLRKHKHRLSVEAERRALDAAEAARAAVMGFPPNSISPMQCRMARAALRWSLSDLAEAAGIHDNTAQLFEAGKEKRGLTMTKIAAAFQNNGVIFPDDYTVYVPPTQQAA